MKPICSIQNKILSVKRQNNEYLYYLDDQLIGVYNPIKMYSSPNKIIFRQNTKENELSGEIKDTISEVVNNIEDEELEKMPNEYNKEQIHVLEKLLDLDEDEKISRISTVKLSQKLKDDKTIEDDEKEPKENEEEIEKESFEENDVNIKQTMNFDDKVTYIKDLGQLIKSAGKMPEMEGKNFIKMGVIESYEMDKLRGEDDKQTQNNTTRYSFVAIATDGTIVPMDLEQDYQEGANPTEKNYQINRNGEIEKDDVLSRFKIGEGTFSIKNGDYGELEVYHSPTKTLGGEGIEGNKSLDIQLETENVWDRTDEERELVSEHTTNYRLVEESYQEAKAHENDGELCDNMKIEDLDGKLNTKSHIPENGEIKEDYVELENGEKITFNELATKWGLYNDNGTPDADYAKQKFIEKSKQNSKNETTNDEIIEQIDEEYNEDIRPTDSRNLG